MWLNHRVGMCNQCCYGLLTNVDHSSIDTLCSVGTGSIRLLSRVVGQYVTIQRSTTAGIIILLFHDSLPLLVLSALTPCCRAFCEQIMQHHMSDDHVLSSCCSHQHQASELP
jgi:hypothetical protein